MYIVRELLTTTPNRKNTQLATALRRLNSSSRQHAIVFILSDFIDAHFSDALRVAGKRHDVVGIKLYDRMDMELPAAGLLEVEDLESGAKAWIDTGELSIRNQYQQSFFEHTDWCKEQFLRAGCDLLHIRTDEDYVKVLQQFFIGRNR